MKQKPLYLSLAFLTALTLGGCGSDSAPFTEGGATSTQPVSDKNFDLFFSDINPAVVDDDGFHGGVEVEVVVTAGDENNTAISGGTVQIRTEWGILNNSSCEISNGSCSVTWTSDSDFAFIPSDFQLTFTAYTTGEESFVDLNGNGRYDDADGDYLRDLTEPFIDISHDGIYTLNTDQIIDLDNNGIHTLGDGLYNGSKCSHTSRCSPTTKVTVFDIGTINLDQRTPTP